MSRKRSTTSTTVLAQDSEVIHRSRREWIQAQERKRFGSVEEREHKPNNPSQDMGEEMNPHPLLSMLQSLDGIDDRIIADLRNNPEAQRELENILRLQHQKKLEKQQALQNKSTPTPGMW